MIASHDCAGATLDEEAIVASRLDESAACPFGLCVVCDSVDLLQVRIYSA